MPSRKTETTELSVGFGLLGYSNPFEPPFSEIFSKFQGSLSIEKHKLYLSEYPKNQNLYPIMLNVGLNLRKTFPLFNNLQTLRWLGPERQASTTSTARDLQAVNVPISVKAKSNVVGNPSPYNLFISTPQGSGLAKGTRSWYLESALSDYQSFYNLAKEITGLDKLPSSVEEFERLGNKKLLINAIKNISTSDIFEFQNLYIKMCHQSAKEAADTFNDNLSHSLNSPVKGSVLERIAKMFFRMNAVEYILCGIDGQNEFAVKIPDLTTWLQNWEFKAIQAAPDFERKQSVVNFSIDIQNKKHLKSYNVIFHAEIRWSHGKFSSVEGKLYKEFNWVDLPFFTQIF